MKTKIIIILEPCFDIRIIFFLFPELNREKKIWYKQLTASQEKMPMSILLRLNGTSILRLSFCEQDQLESINLKAKWNRIIKGKPNITIDHSIISILCLPLLTFQRSHHQCIDKKWHQDKKQIIFKMLFWRSKKLGSALLVFQICQYWAIFFGELNTCHAT